MSDQRLFLARRIETLLGPATAPADALVTCGEWVVGVGERDDLRRRFPDLEPLDFGEGVIVPGFNDAHQHPSLVAADLLHLDLSPEAAPTVEAVCAAISEEARHLPTSQWIRGSRYDETKLAGRRVLSRADLDAAAPSHPVVVSHVSAHWGIANSRALQLAGLGEDSEAPPGGVLGRDPSGRLNGVLAERAFFDFAYSCFGGASTILPSPSLEDWLVGLDRLQDRLAGAGLTSITDALVGPDELRLFQEARRRGLLRLRVEVLVAHPHLDRLAGLGIRSGFGDSRLRIGGIKVILDGSVSARSCLVEEPFAGTGDRGVQVTPLDELRDILARARRAGCRLAVHANGDRAIALLLDELDRLESRLGPPEVADRIEHCSIVTPSILERMAARGMAAVPFGPYISFHGDKLLSSYGPERLEWMFAHRSFLEAGIPVGGSSDHPCGPFEPLLAMQSCVTRQTPEGQVLGGSQRIGSEEALRLYTLGSASVSGQAGLKGALAPGRLADFVVLAEDPLAVDPARLARVPVRATFVGGRQIWSDSR